MGKLYFKYGAMNCGKSTQVLQVAHNFEEKNKKVIVVKPMIDKKGGDLIVSRAIKETRKVDVLLDKEDNIYNIVLDYAEKEKNLSNITTKPYREYIAGVLVDEAQFLESDQVDQLWYISKKLQIPVLCYGLLTNFQKYLFPGSKRLIELADDLEELVTICDCGHKARFNSRFINNKFVIEGPEVSIDGIDSFYNSQCPECRIKSEEQLILKK